MPANLTIYSLLATRNSKFQNLILISGIFRLSLCMRIFTEQQLLEFIQQHPETKTALAEWKYIVRHSVWRNISDIKKNFQSVTALGSQRYMFYLSNRNVQIEVTIKFSIYFVYINHVKSTNTGTI